MNEFLADVIDLVHLAYVGFVAIGQLMIWLGLALGWSWVRNFWFRTVHLVMILIVALEAVAGMICPLTDWAAKLRYHSSEKTFVQRLAENIFKLDIPFNSPVLQWSYYIAAAVILATFVLAPPRWPKRKQKNPVQ